MLSRLRPVVIVTCVGYFDFLRQTLPHTLEFASKIYLVTDVPFMHPGVETIVTDAFVRGGAVFNKAAAVRDAQLLVHAAHPDSWILLLDADIIASPDLFFDATDKRTLYSVSRIDYRTPEEYREGRGVPYDMPGAGYCQLYWDKTKLYPEHSDDASHCDMEFYWSFPEQRILGGAVHHLGEKTVNWKGRVSPAWAPACDLATELAVPPRAIL